MGLTLVRARPARSLRLARVGIRASERARARALRVCGWAVPDRRRHVEHVDGARRAVWRLGV